MQRAWLSRRGAAFAICALGTGMSLDPALTELGAEPDAIVEAIGGPSLVPAAPAVVRRRGDVVRPEDLRATYERISTDKCNGLGVVIEWSWVSMPAERSVPFP